jgi:hypothetical protein
MPFIALAPAAADLYAGIPEAEFEVRPDKARKVAAELAGTVIDRDNANKDTHEGVGPLRTAGSLGLAIPKALGDAGATLLRDARNHPLHLRSRRSLFSTELQKASK